MVQQHLNAMQAGVTHLRCLISILGNCEGGSLQRNKNTKLIDLMSMLLVSSVIMERSILNKQRHLFAQEKVSCDILIWAVWAVSCQSSGCSMLVLRIRGAAA